MAKRLAEKQGNLGFYQTTEKSFTIEVYNIKERIRFKRIGLPSRDDFYQDYFSQFGREISQLFKPNSRLTSEAKRAIESAENILNLLADGQLSQIEFLLENRTSVIDIGALAANGDERIFPLVEKHFMLENEKNRATILSFSIASGKPEQFVHLFSISPPTSQRRQEGLIERAYYVAERIIIKFLESREEESYQLWSGRKSYVLLKGYLADPKPVEVYQIVKAILSDNNNLKDVNDDIEALSKFDVDIFFLQDFTQKQLVPPSQQICPGETEI